MQACAFRGHDESSESSNRGNFYEMLKYTASINENIAEVVLEMLQEMPNIRRRTFKRKS